MCPVGLVQVLVPSCRCLTCQPAWCLALWCLAQRAARFAGFVSPPSVQASVVEVAQLGCTPASGEGAGSVAGGDVVGEVRGWPVGFAAVVEELAGVVGDQPPPRTRLVRGEAAGHLRSDGPVPVEVGGLLIAAQQGTELDGDLDRGSLSVLLGQGRVSEYPGEHLHQRVGAALIRAAVVGLSAGEGVEHGFDERGALGRQPLDEGPGNRESAFGGAGESRNAAPTCSRV